MSKILQSNSKQTRKKYIPARSMWLQRVFTDLPNTNKRHCLTIDCSGVKKVDLADIGLKLIILINKFSILIRHVMTNFIMFL